MILLKLMVFFCVFMYLFVTFGHEAGEKVNIRPDMEGDHSR